MRRLLPIIISLFFVSFAFGNPISKEKAKEVAKKYFEYRVNKTKSSEINEIYAKEYNGLITYYSINFKEGGFVIISADDRVTPILAYSTTNSIKNNNLNPEVKYWLSGYDKQIEYIVNNDLDNYSTKIEWNNIINNVFDKDANEVTPLLTTTWNQETGYNDYCPGGYTGCVATAMSQIMNYHEFPVSGAKSHRYSHPTYGEQSIDFSSVNYDWANMPDASGSDAVAVLMRHAGVAVDMDYSTSGSGAQSRDVTYALANYFKYDQGISIEERANYSDAAWIALIKNELDNSRPVYYSGDDGSSGHAWVCDGYNNSDQLHLNWGWGGSSNGYFTLGNFNAGGYQPNENNNVIVGIKPSTAVNEEFLAVKNFSDLSNQTTNTSPYIGYMDAVSDNVAWGIARDGSGNDADYRTYTRTIDGGNTWVAKKIENLGGTAFSMIYGLSDQVAYISMYGTGSGNHVLRTTDGGTNWTSVLDGAGGDSFFNVVHFFDANNGFSQGDPESGYYELYTTTDGGDNWTRVPSSNIPAPLSGEYGIVGYYTAIADTIWYTTNKGRVYKSEDKGLNWNVYTIYSGSNDTNISIAFDNEGQNGLAHVSLSSGSTHVGDEYYNTTDGGENWNQLSPIGNFYDSDISSVPGEPNTFISVGADYQTPKMGMSYTTDGGETWIEYPKYYQNYQMLSVDMISANSGFIGAFAGDWSDGVWSLYGTHAPELSADFYAGAMADTLFCASGVQFTDDSQGVITSRTWTFGEGATPATATGAGPHTVTYATGGEKEVHLTISDGVDNDEKIAFIKVSGAAPSDISSIDGPTTVVPVGSTQLYSVTQDPELYTYYNWSVGYFQWTGNGSMTNEYEVTFTGFATNSTVECYATNGCGDGGAFALPVHYTAGVGVETIGDEMKVFPNPANNVLQIEGLEGKLISIYDISGKLVYTNKINSDNFTIDISNFSDGVYSIKVLSGDLTMNGRFIISK